MSTLDATRLERIGAFFAQYVDDGRLPGVQLAVTHRGERAYGFAYGQRDREAAAPVEDDTVWRIYSMTKPITSVAAMLLWEEGAFELKDPIAKWLPAFGESRVWRGGSATAPVTEPLTEPIRVWHLMSHTAGLTYGFHHAHPVDTLYRQAGFEFGTPPGLDLAGCCDAWAALPLLFQPGREWNYSVATDVLGRLLEVISGQPLDELLAERVLGPLGMTDTRFGEAPPDRVAALYTQAGRNDALGDVALSRPAAFQGGGGLVSTLADYGRFVAMLADRGQPLLGSRTLDLMTANHMPGGADLEQYGRPLFAETTFDGVGFGLGFHSVLDPVAGRGAGSAGEFGWGGAASTSFFVDPAEQVTGIFLTSLLPSTTYPLRSQFRQLIYQAFVG